MSRERREPRPFSSSLFTRVVRRRIDPQEVSVTDNSRLLLECRCANVDPSLALAITGEGEVLGWWGASRVIVMADGEFPVWRVAMDEPMEPTEFKFVLVDRLTHEIKYWESGYNRLLRVTQSEGVERVECYTPIFDDAPLWRGVGVSIPIFSLRTEQSMGVGDFYDLKRMVDWAVEREMSVIQILPINDTIMDGTWRDSYPYNSNSTIALHPQDLALREVGVVANDSLREEFESRAQELNALEQIDYPEMMRLKMEYLREIFAQQQGVMSPDYQEFVETNRWWLEPYTLYSYLRDLHSTPDFREWGEWSKYSAELYDRLDDAARQELEFYCFVQYHLHLQLLDASNYARSKGVAIKGDIPIGVSRTSVEVWQHPRLFRVDMQAGAPPDPFSAVGQTWGFPTYNWDIMARDGYSWWVARMRKMAEYFDAYRIDHILGLFRIWEIPLGAVQGLTGHFSPALPLLPEQINQLGVTFKDHYTTPYITDEVLKEHLLGLEGCDIKSVIKRYFAPAEWGGYRFKRGYNTQRKIVDSCEESPLRDQLILLHNEVLFVEDGAKRGSYHPRIAGCDTYLFKSLTPAEQHAFRSLHDDFYYSRHNEFWRDSAMMKLPTLVESTEMLVCGEDLGMIPACVEDVMNELEILSLEIERMPKQTGVRFADPAHYPYLSVCTTSTHDMTTIRGWWREDRALIESYCCEALSIDGDSPKECSAEVARLIIDRHINSSSMLTILPWQDWMAVDELLRNPDVEAERINVPANSRHYWRYRMHLTL